MGPAALGPKANSLCVCAVWHVGYKTAVFLTCVSIHCRLRRLLPDDTAYYEVRWGCYTFC